MKKIIALITTIALFSSCISTTVSTNYDNDSNLNEMQLLEKHDDYVPWWLQLTPKKSDEN